MLKVRNLVIVLVAISGLLLGCEDDPISTIPIEITSIQPSEDTAITTGTQFTVTIDYTIPAMESGLTYRISAGFAVDTGGIAGGAQKDVTAQSGTVVLSFTFTDASYLVYPYELTAYLYEVHPDYDYQIDHSATKKYN
jgi:hypothetical protein